MLTVKSCQDFVNRIILDPKFHEPLALVKAVRNGFVCGIQIRLPHALVITLLFGSGTTREKIVKIFQATRQHALCLANFALIYKSICLGLKRINQGKEDITHTFLAGLFGGYWVFGRDQASSSSVVQQMVMYAMARAMIGLGKLAVRTESKHIASITRYEHRDWQPVLHRVGWPVSASLCWAVIMWLFRWHPDTLQPSLRNNLGDIYVKSEKWDSFETLLLGSY